MASVPNDKKAEDTIEAKPFDSNNISSSSGTNQHDLVTSENIRNPLSDGDSGFQTGDSGFQTSSLVLSEDVSPMSYVMNHPGRGRMVVICNSKFEPSLKLSDRSGHEKDINALRDTFANTMHFDWNILENQTAHEMYSAMLKESKKDHSNSDCFMVAFLTHGEGQGKIFGTDESITIDKLIEPLKTCKSLGGKPKFVVIQACRGKSVDRGVVISHDGGGSSTDTSIILPVEADFLYAYSTADGYVAFNNPKQGSWFIQALCAEFKANSKKFEVMQMLTRVCHKIAYEHASYTPSRPETHNLKQVSSVTTTLTKALYFK